MTCVACLRRKADQQDLSSLRGFRYPQTTTRGNRGMQASCILCTPFCVAGSVLVVVEALVELTRGVMLHQQEGQSGVKQKPCHLRHVGTLPPQGSFYNLLHKMARMIRLTNSASCHYRHPFDKTAQDLNSFTSTCCRSASTC